MILVCLPTLFISNEINLAKEAIPDECTMCWSDGVMSFVSDGLLLPMLDCQFSYHLPIT
jgi:hypothetical protein